MTKPYGIVCVCVCVYVCVCVWAKCPHKDSKTWKSPTAANSPLEESSLINILNNVLMKI